MGDRCFICKMASTPERLDHFCIPVCVFIEREVLYTILDTSYCMSIAVSPSQRMSDTNITSVNKLTAECAATALNIEKGQD